MWGDEINGLNSSTVMKNFHDDRINKKKYTMNYKWLTFFVSLLLDLLELDPDSMWEGGTDRYVQCSGTFNWYTKCPSKSVRTDCRIRSLPATSLLFSLFSVFSIFFFMLISALFSLLLLPWVHSSSEECSSVLSVVSMDIRTLHDPIVIVTGACVSWLRDEIKNLIPSSQ